MNKLIVAVAFAMFATAPAMAQSYNDDTNVYDNNGDAIESGTTSDEMDTTLTDEPGVLEEQNTPSSAQDNTVDQPATATEINDHSVNTQNYYFPPSRTERDIQSGATAEAPMNQSTATAPRGIDGRGSWNLNAGPALTLGLDSDNVLYGVGGGYTFNLTPALGARVFADANFSGAEDSSSYLDLGAAAKLGIGNVVGQQTSRAYLLGDVALASARNSDTDHSESGLALGAGLGYNVLRTQRTDIDLLLRYALMLNDIDGKNPSLLTARVGVNF